MIYLSKDDRDPFKVTFLEASLGNGDLGRVGPTGPNEFVQL
jgi:hypothetical protein